MRAVKSKRGSAAGSGECVGTPSLLTNEAMFRDSE